MNKRLLTLIVIIVLTSYVTAQSTSKPPFDDSNVFGSIELTEEWIKKNKVPVLNIGIISGGEIQSISSYGYVKPGQKASYNTIFNVASLAKPITAVVALKLIDQNLWNLDEPLYTYFTDPDVKDHEFSKLLTTRHVLSHQSGLPNWRYSDSLNVLRFGFKPGEGYQYSGEGMEYLRKSLESHFKISLNDLAEKYVFHPLGMKDTRYNWSLTTDVERYTDGYNDTGIPYPKVKRIESNAADDLITTIEDYSKLLIHVFLENGLSDSLYSEMISHQVETNKGKHFGLGFERYDFDDGQYALTHGGSDEGVKTIFFIFPESRNGLVIFTNSDTGMMVFEKVILNYLGNRGKEIIAIEMGK